MERLVAPGATQHAVVDFSDQLVGARSRRAYLSDREPELLFSCCWNRALFDWFGQAVIDFDITAGDCLHHIGDPIERVVFPHSGVICMTVPLRDTAGPVVALVGREGMVGGLLATASMPSSCNAEAWILEPSATGLCKPDLHVFAKLFEDRLERGLEAQALSGREIGGDDDVLDFLVGHLVNVDLTRQPAS